MLPPGAAGPVRVNTQVLFIDIDINGVIKLRENKH